MFCLIICAADEMVSQKQINKIKKIISVHCLPNIGAHRFILMFFYFIQKAGASQRDRCKDISLKSTQLATPIPRNRAKNKTL